MPGLLVGLREPGLDTTRPLLVVIDGTTALAPAVREGFDAPVLPRRSLHKIRLVSPATLADLRLGVLGGGRC